MKLQIIQALLAFLFLAARISTGNVCNIKLGKEARGNGMDTHCHRTMLSLPSPPTWRIRLIAEKKPVPVTIGLTQITCPPQFVLDALYPSLGVSSIEKRKKVASKESAESSFLSLVLSARLCQLLRSCLALESRSFQNSSNERGNILFRGRKGNWKTFSFEKMIIG